MFVSAMASVFTQNRLTDEQLRLTARDVFDVPTLGTAPDVFEASDVRIETHLRS